MLSFIPLFHSQNPFCLHCEKFEEYSPNIFSGVFANTQAASPPQLFFFFFLMEIGSQRFSILSTSEIPLVMGCQSGGSLLCKEETGPGGGSDPHRWGS